MKRVSLLAALVFLFRAFSAQAAQVAVVRTDNANLYKGPQADSPVVGHLKSGVRLIASSYPVGDSYKVKTAEGEIGWVKASDLGLDGVKNVSAPSPTPSMTPSG